MLLLSGAPLERGFVARALRRLLASAASLGTLCLLLAAWQMASERVGAFILEPPGAVLEQAWRLVLSADAATLAVTAKRALVGAGLSLAIGSALGLCAHIWRSFALFVRPIVSTSLFAVPIVWVVLAIFWFGASDFGVIFVVCVCSFGYTFSASLNALNAVPQGCLDMARVYKFSVFKWIFKFYLPFCLPQLLPAWLIAIANAAKLTIMAELLGAAEGVGSRVADARAVLQNDVVLAYLLLCVAFIMLIESVLIKNLELLLIKDKNV